MKRGIRLEIPDGGKKLLMPHAQKNPAASLQMGHPGLFILDGQQERPGVEPDHPAQEGLDLSGYRVSILFEHQTLSLPKEAALRPLMRGTSDSSKILLDPKGG